MKWRGFAWGICLGVSADFFRLEKGTLTSKPASFNRKEGLAVSNQQSAVGKEIFVKPKRVARKRSGGRVYG